MRRPLGCHCAWLECWVVGAYCNKMFVNRLCKIWSGLSGFGDGRFAGSINAVVHLFSTLSLSTNSKYLYLGCLFPFIVQFCFRYRSV